MQTCTYAHTCECTYTHRGTCTNIHAHSHTCTCLCTHTHFKQNAYVKEMGQALTFKTAIVEFVRQRYSLVKSNYRVARYVPAKQTPRLTLQCHTDEHAATWYRRVWHGLLQDSIVWYGTTWYSREWCNMHWCVTVWFGGAQLSITQFIAVQGEKVYGHINVYFQEMLQFRTLLYSSSKHTNKQTNRQKDITDRTVQQANGNISTGIV